MPLYDFACHGCGERFEARGSTDSLPACPSCGSKETERLLSSFAGPFTVAPRGLAARRSNAQRRVREEQRSERLEEGRRQREEPGAAPSPKPDR